MITTFEQELDKLRTRIIKMGSLVDEQVEYAFRALNEWNVGLAQLVMERDNKVDKLDYKIEKQCQRIFALQQPVARDLRLIMAALKINGDLERVGDLAFNIARSVEAPVHFEFFRSQPTRFDPKFLNVKVVEGFSARYARIIASNFFSPSTRLSPGKSSDRAETIRYQYCWL